MAAAMKKTDAPDDGAMRGISPAADMNDPHWRIDEQERRLGAIEEALTPEMVAAVVAGAVAALKAQMQTETQALLKAVTQDRAGDGELIAAVKELVQTLRAPITRVSTINLPSGPVSMTVNESRSGAAN